MRTTKSPVVGVLLALSFVAACRGGGDAKPDASSGDAGDGRIHIQDVQSDKMAVNTAVELHGVVVTAIDKFNGTPPTMGRVGDFWVEEPGGGPFSGVHVFGAQLAQVADLMPGDVVDITGTIKVEFKQSADATGRTVTELQAPRGSMMTVTKTGIGVVPEPHVIDAVAFGMMTGEQRDAEYEKWEGVLIKLQNVAALYAPVGFGSTPYPEDSFKFEVSGKFVVESTQSAFPTSVDGTTCIASVTGVEDYIFDWLILPRTTSELVLGGTGCPLPPTVTVSAIQMGTATGNVIVNNAYVTAVAAKTIWVADALQAATNNGVAVFFNNVAIDPNVVVGAKLTVRGTVSEFDVGTPKVGDTLTEIITPSVSGITAPTDPPTPMAVTTAQVGDIATGEAYEGVLVQGTQWKVTAAPANNNNQVTLTDNNGGTLTMDDDVFANYGGTAQTPTLPAVGTCYETLTGVMSVQLTANIRTVNPRSAADMVAGTGCN